MAALGDVIQRGALASRPAAGTAGRLYHATDVAGGTLYRDSGSAWEAVALANPMTAAGDIVIGGAGGAPVRLAAGADGEVLTIASGVPTWAAGGGGGGGGGAPTTAAYVVGAADGTLSNEVVVPRYAAHPDAKPASPDAFDDEFDSFAGWTWVNQGGATATAAGSILGLTAPGASGDNIRQIVRSVGSTPWTVTARVGMLARYSDWLAAGLTARESSTGKFYLFGFSFDSFAVGGSDQRLGLQVAKAAGNTNIGTSAAEMRVYAPWGYLQIEDDGTTISFRASLDGHHFLTLYSESRTAHLAGGADQVGLGANANSGSSYGVLLTCDWVRKS